MENTLLIGLSRQIALQRELDVVANNVANMNTTGYKADGAIFEEYLMPQAQAAGFQGADRRVSYVQDRATWRDFGSGPIRPTGNPLDVAIDGDAFFVVQTPRGERYTRNGAFQINAQGELVTNTGDRVVGDGGPIQFQSTDNSISINLDGTITAREGGNSSRLKQGSIEQSNVHSVIEMSRMIEVTRTYTQITAMMQQFSDLRRSAVEKLAEVPA